MISVLLVEDHAIMARAITEFLEEQAHLSVAAVVGSAEAAEEKLPGLTVDLVLVDVSLPGMNGIDLVERIHRVYPKLPCVMLSGHRSAKFANRSLAVGARGYLLKDDIEGILRGIPEVLDGRVYVSEGVLNT